MVLIFILIYIEWRDFENQQYVTSTLKGLGVVFELNIDFNIVVPIQKSIE